MAGVGCWMDEVFSFFSVFFSFRPKIVMIPRVTGASAKIPVIVMRIIIEPRRLFPTFPHKKLG